MTIEVFISTVSGSIQIKKRQRTLLDFLDGEKKPYTLYDISQTEFTEQKQRLRDLAGGSIVLPSVVVNGKWKGEFEKFEEAIECGTTKDYFEP